MGRTVSLIGDAGGATVRRKTADQSTTLAGVTIVDDLSLALNRNQLYQVQAWLLITSAAAGNGMGVGVQFSLGSPATTPQTCVGLVNGPVTVDGTSCLYTGCLSTFGDIVITSAIPTTTDVYLLQMDLVVKTNTTGAASATMDFVFRTENAGTACVIKADSLVFFQAIAV